MGELVHRRVRVTLTLLLVERPFWPAHLPLWHSPFIHTNRSTSRVGVSTLGSLQYLTAWCCDLSQWICALAVSDPCVGWGRASRCPVGFSLALPRRFSFALSSRPKLFGACRAHFRLQRWQYYLSRTSVAFFPRLWGTPPCMLCSFSDIELLYVSHSYLSAVELLVQIRIHL